MLFPTDAPVVAPDDQAPDPRKPFDPAKADAQAKAILAGGGSQHDVDTYLHQTYGLQSTEPGMQGHNYHAEYASGALGARMAGANARDAANLADEQGSDAPSSTLGAFGQSLAATGANIAQGIPGMEAVEAGARSGVRSLASKVGIGQPQSYREALSDIQGATNKIPTPLRVGEKIAGALPVAALLPASPALSGAIVGGADEALGANPDESLTERGVRTAAGAATGAILGKGLDKLATVGKALVPASMGGAGPTADRLLQMQADRAQSARALYGTALDEGQGKAPTQAIIDYINEPEIADRIAKLRELEPLKNLPPESPAMLDALYKSFSDEAKAVQKSAGALDPTKINLGRFRGQHIGARQSQLLDAMSAPGTETTTVPAPLTAQSPNPSLRDALTNFRGRAGAAVNRTDGPPLSRDAPWWRSTVNETDPLAHDSPFVTPRPVPASSGAGETVAQKLSRQALERHAAENVVSPPLTGAPSATTVTTQTPPMMSSYPNAVNDFKQRSQSIDALQKGYEALRTSLADNLPTAKNLTRKTPQAFAEWARTATPEQIQAARQGILGGTRDALAQPGLTLAPGRRAAGNAAKLLRLTPTTDQTTTEVLQNLGLLTAGNSSP